VTLTRERRTMRRAAAAPRPEAEGGQRHPPPSHPPLANGLRSEELNSPRKSTQPVQIDDLRNGRWGLGLGMEEPGEFHEGVPDTGEPQAGQLGPSRLPNPPPLPCQTSGLKNKEGENVWFTSLICGLQPCMTLSQASFRQLAQGPLEEDLLSAGSFGLSGGPSFG